MLSRVRVQAGSVRREAELYPDGRKDFIVTGVLASELSSAPAVPTLLLSGTVGVGKSTIAAEIVDVLAEAETNSAAIDLDALTWQRPPSSPFNRDLMVENLTRLWPNYQAHGVTRLVLARVVESPDELSSYRTAVPGADITVCRLTAPQQMRIERLRERMPAGPSRDWHEQRTVELEAILQAAAVEDFVVSNDRSPRELARSGCFGSDRRV